MTKKSELLDNSTPINEVIVDNRIESVYFVFFSISLWYLFSAHSLALWRFDDSIVWLLRMSALLLSAFVYVGNLSLYSNREKRVLLLVSCIIVIDLFLLKGYLRWQLWLLFVMVVGAKDIDLLRIVKYHLIINVCLCLSNIIAYHFGFVDSTNALGDERESMGLAEGVIQRVSLGYPASSDLATHIMYLIIDYWIIRKGVFRLIDYILVFCLFYFVIFSCDSRQPAVCILLIIIFAFLITRKELKGKVPGRIVGTCLIISTPLFFILTLVVILLYDESNSDWIAANIILSGRLGFGLEAIQEYGVHFFGQQIQFVGAGFDNIIDEYNYVDSGYLQMLLLWGGAVMLICLGSFVKIARDSYKRVDMVLLLSLFISSVSTLTTQFLFYPNYCILILALTASYKQNFHIGLSPLRDS